MFVFRRDAMCGSPPCAGMRDVLMYVRTAPGVANAVPSVRLCTVCKVLRPKEDEDKMRAKEKREEMVVVSVSVWMKDDGIAPTTSDGWICGADCRWRMKDETEGAGGRKRRGVEQVQAQVQVQPLGLSSLWRQHKLLRGACSLSFANDLLFLCTEYHFVFSRDHVLSAFASTVPTSPALGAALVATSIMCRPNMDVDH